MQRVSHEKDWQVLDSARIDAQEEKCYRVLKTGGFKCTRECGLVGREQVGGVGEVGWCGLSQQPSALMTWPSADCSILTRA